DDAKAANSLLSELKSRSGSTPDEVLRVATGELTMTSLRGHLRETLESTSLVAPLADRSRDPLIHSSFLNVHAATLLSNGRYAEAFAVAERETSVAQTYGLAFVSPAAQYHAAAAQWGLRNFRNCQTRLNRVARAAAAGDDGFLLMNVGTLWARLHLAMGAPDRALSKLEDHQHPVSTRGMEAEYLAWRSLTVALAKYANEARRLADRAVA